MSFGSRTGAGTGTGTGTNVPVRGGVDVPVRGGVAPELVRRDMHSALSVAAMLQSYDLSLAISHNLVAPAFALYHPSPTPFSRPRTL